MVRALGKAFEQRNPHGFVVESRPGANTIIAANACKGGGARRLHDLSAVAQHGVDQSGALQDAVLRSAEGFRADHQLASSRSRSLILNKNVPVKDFKELVAYSKQNPDKLNFGSFGVGGDSHLIIEWLKHETGAKITHVPYKGASEAMLAFKAGDVQMI